jgi:RNA polymerase sigma-70 factor (ECF subfamily)
MSITEERQETQRPMLSHQPQQKVPSAGLAPTLSTAILPDGVGHRRHPPYGPSAAISPDRLVYAVYQATELACRSGYASRDRTDHRCVEEDISDEMLLQHVAGGDKAAMHIMFARHRARVFHFIQRMVRNPAIAEDLVSQVFLDVWRSANKFDRRARASTWLLAIARFKALTSLRRRGCENVDQDDMDGIADTGETPEAALDRKDRNGILRACIDRLSPAHREIIDLVYYHDKSVAEASELIGIPDGTAKSRLFCARKQLARVLVSAGFEAAAVQANIEERRETRPSRDRMS